MARPVDALRHQIREERHRQPADHAEDGLFRVEDHPDVIDDHRQDRHDLHAVIEHRVAVDSRPGGKLLSDRRRGLAPSRPPGGLATG